MSLINNGASAPSPRMKMLGAWFPWAMLGVAVLYLASKAIPPSAGPDGYDVAAFGQIPVLEEGRVKPLDSVARVSLMAISSRSEFEDSRDGKMKPAIDWMLDVMSNTAPLASPAADHKVFRIENDQVLSFLGLEQRPGSYRYSLREILTPQSRFAKVAKEFERVSEIPSKKQTIYEQKIAELSHKVKIYEEIHRRNAPLAIPPQAEGQEWRSITEIDRDIATPKMMQIQAMAREQVNKNRVQIIEDVQKQFMRGLEARGIDLDRLSEEKRRELHAEMMKQVREEEQDIIKRTTAQIRDMYVEMARPNESPAAEAYLKMLRAWEARSAGDFNAAVKEYRENYLGRVPGEEVAKSRYETEYNRLAPFYHSAGLFVFAFVLGCASWIGWTRPLSQASTYVCLLALVVHSAAMLVRIYLQGRPPVTNLYSSALFIGWGCVGVCLVLEGVYRNGIGNVVGSFLGFATMIIAHHLGMGKDTLEKLEAVLDTNFWLATHVTTVTLGYTATFIAGFIGIVYIVRGVFTTSLDPQANRALTSMMYGIICFATLLSFVGTVLGGIWADQSWGRFWGWDPKENGAVLIVLWNALILHARWAGIVKSRGMAVLTLIGNMITVWSWFGTNQLQTGLHSYGFDSSLARGCRYVWLAHLGLIAIGLLPLKYWRSFSDQPVKGGGTAARTRDNRPKVVKGQAK